MGLHAGIGSHPLVSAGDASQRDRYLPARARGACIAAFAARGFTCVAERHAGLTDNFSYGEIPPAEIAAMTRAALAEAPAEAVVYFCTNFGGASVAAGIEAEYDVPVLDSTALGVWGALSVAGYDTAGIDGWGRVFQLRA